MKNPTIKSQDIYRNGLQSNALRSGRLLLAGIALLLMGVTTVFAQDVTIGSGTTVTNPSGTTMNINGNLTINSGGTLANAGTIIITGNWTNNGTYTGAGGFVQFTGALSSTISGSAPSALNNFTLNKGASTATVLDVSGSGAVSCSTATFTSGLLRINAGGSFSKVNGNITAVSSTSGIHVNGGTFSAVNSIQSMAGSFTVSSGSATVGTSSGNSLQATSTSTVAVSGGTLNIASRLEMSGGSLNISGGVITLNTVANTTSSTGSLNMTATANLNMTNGTVIFQFPNSTGFQDVNLLAGGGTKTITGGTLQFGNASTAAASIFKISSPISVNNITINSNNNPQLTLVAALTINGTLTMNGGNINPAGLTLLENNTAPAAIVRTSGFVNGQLKWQLPASVIAPGAYLFPVGKNSTYLPYTLTNPSGNSPLISVEAFDIGSGGSADLTTVFGISNTEYWLASNTGTFTAGSVTLARPAAVTPNDRIARHATSQAGPYFSIGGTPSGNSISGGNATGLGYFVMAQGCDAATFTACPSNVTAFTALNLCTATVSYTATVSGAPAPTVSYTFSGATTGSGSGTGSGSVFNKGTTNITITATNACGSATCTLSVTVNDNQAPNAICQNILVSLDATGNASITPSQVNNGSTDNCGVVNLVSVTPNTFNCSNVGLAASATDLIFSEYVEGSSNNKYLEIFNGTSGAINLGDYRLRLYANGASSPTNDILLSGTLNAGQTIVYRNTSAVIYGGTAIVNAAVNFNGNDALALYKVSTASNVDIFGRIGNDPIGSWSLGGNTTVDKTLRRKPTVVSGVTVNPTGTGPGAFLTLGTEWDQFNIDDVTGLGAHTFTPPPAPTPVTLTINDGNGNTSTCVANVLVQDVTPPSAICQNISVNLSGTGTVSVNASQVNNGSSDACGIATMTLTPNSFTCANVGPNPVTLTVTDVNGLSSTCTATVTVVDNTPPVASCQNILVNLSAAGTASITASLINNGSSDNCGIATMTVNPNTFNCSNVTGGGGSSSAWINEFHYDNSGTDAGEFIEIAGTAGLNLTGWSVVLYNGANGLSYTTTPLSGSIVNQSNGFGFVVLNYPVDGIQNGAPDGIALVNNLGNVIQFLSYEGSFTALNGPANGQTSVNIPVSEAGAAAAGSSLQLTGTGNSYASFTWAPEALATSNAVNNGQTFVAPTGNTVTLTVTDVNGLVSTCTAIVSVVDVTPPVATCQNITVPLNANGTVAVTASQVNNGSSDACGIASMSLSQTNFTCANIGANPVTLTVTDVNGLTSTCSATITITDVTPPVANCQNLTIALDGTGNASITASQINNGSTDACGLNPNMTITPNTFNCSDVVGDPMNDLIISEYIEGNVGSNKYIELYNGTAAPINLGNYRLRLYANGATATTNDVLLSGTLGVGQTIVYQNSAATFYTGPVINNAAVNFNGDDAVVLFKVSTGIPVDIFGRIGEDPGAAWTSGAITTVDVALRRKSTVTQGVTVNPASGFPTLSTEWDQFAPSDVSGLGAHLLNAGNLVTLTVTDVNGNSSTCTAYVTVQDVTAPTLNCPVVGNTNRNTDPGVCNYTGVGTEFNATASDNCGFTLTYQLLGVTGGTGTTLAGKVFNKGVTLVTWTASDGVNAPVTCSFSVTVTDNQQPLITCPVALNANRNTNPGQCTYTVVGTEFNATSTDNCAVTSMTYTLGGVTSGSGTSLTGVVFNKGVTSITWTATDGVNPAVTCNFTVTVVDAEFPVFTLACPASFAACNAPGISWTPPIATDNCSVVLTSNMSPGDVFPPGTTTVTYSAEDPAGNITTCSFDVTVKEVSQDPVSASALPAVICSGDQTTLSVNGGFLGTGAQWKWYSGTCGGALVGIGASIQVNPLASTTYFVRAEGDCNTTNCASVSVTVQTTSTDPTSATSNAPVNGICLGGSVILSVSGGSLGTGAVWKWYEDGCGNGLSIGTGSSITVTPAFDGLHSYYVRAEGPCNTTNCAAVSVLVGTYSVEATSITSSIAGNSICTGNNITLTLNGGFLGTVAQWKWYSGTCGGTLVATGVTTITVNPAVTTTYYVRAEGSCNNTNCTSILVSVSNSAPSNPPPTITSAPNGICSGNGSTVICQSVPGATFYSWSAPNGTTFNGNNPSPYITTTNTVQVTFGNLPNGVSGYDICVFAGNGCGNTVTKCRYIRGRVQSAQTITGNASSCPNTNSVYSIVSLPGADTYTWTVTGAATINGGGTTLTTTATSVTVNFLPGWTSGTLSVYGSMSCGYNAPTKTITIISTPVVPGVMSGPILVCPGGTYNYSIAPVAGAVSYNWSTNVPGAIVGAGTTSVNITFPAVIPAGSTVSVTATGSCGTSAPRVKNIATGLSNTPGTISGPAMGQCGQTGVGYSILPVAGATSYLWTATNGASISGLNNITSVSVDFPALFTNSNVNVVAINGCGNSAPQTKLVTGAPGSPGVISGSGAVCLNSVETYSVVGSTGATQYVWTSPVGSQILSGQNFASIQVLYLVNTGGNISVTATNACGSSAAVNLAVSVVCRLAQISQGSLIDAMLYPNPTIGTTTLKFETITAGDYKVSVVDMTGQEMQTQNVTAVEGVNLHELDLSTYAKGLYMVRLEREGEAMQMLRVTVE